MQNAAAEIDFTPYLDRARTAYRAGRVADAEAIARAVVTLEPRHANALSLLGVVQDSLGAHQDAVDSLRSALAVRDSAPFRTNLGLALGKLGRWQEAADQHRHAIALRPDYPQALNNLGVALDKLADREGARDAFSRAIALHPDWPDAWINLGLLQRSLGLHDAALACFERAVALRPEDEAALLHAGLEHADGGHTAAALDRFAAAHRLNPSNPDALCNCGLALQNLGRFDEAEAAYRQALAVRPDHPGALSNLGSLLRATDRLDGAITVLNQAVALQPGHADAHTTLAVALQENGQVQDALQETHTVLALQPQDADAHHHRGMLLLMQGAWRDGWPEYEWRMRTRQARGAIRTPDLPQWRGQPAEGRSILLHAEQGLGDTLQFIRYAPLVGRRGLRLAIEVQAPLKRLIAAMNLPPETTVLAQGEPLPPTDLHCPLLSLPLAFGTEPPTTPADIPYLTADPQKAAFWQSRLAALPDRKVGLVWAGGQRPHLPQTVIIDRRRSMGLDRFAALAGVPSVSLVSLQKGPPAGQPAPPGLDLLDVTNALQDFADTAALVDALDLVISVDTAVAHLAGAMGKPVWLLNRFDACWRWGREAGTSPWYPTLRQFRQPAPGDWDTPLAQVRAALLNLPA